MSAKFGFASVSYFGERIAVFEMAGSHDREIGRFDTFGEAVDFIRPLVLPSEQVEYWERGVLKYCGTLANLETQPAAEAGMAALTRSRDVAKSEVTK